MHGMVRHVHCSSHYGLCNPGARIVGFMCMCYLMYGLVMLGYAEAFYVWVCACG